MGTYVLGVVGLVFIIGNGLRWAGRKLKADPDADNTRR